MPASPDRSPEGARRRPAERPLPRPTAPGRTGAAWGIGLGVTALSLVLLLGAAGTYLGYRLQQLDAEIQELAIAQAELKDALAALDAAAAAVAAPPAPEPAPAPAAPAPANPAAAAPTAAAEPPAAPAIPAPELSMPSLAPPPEAPPAAPAGSEGLPAATIPAPATAAPPAAAPPAADPGAAPAPAAALLGTGYTVRIFAPAQNIAGERLTKLQKMLEGLGFSVGVSDDGLFEPPSSSISYHPATKAIADKLIASLRSSFPKLQLDIVAPEAMPDSTRKIIILTLAGGALG